MFLMLLMINSLAKSYLVMKQAIIEESFFDFKIVSENVVYRDLCNSIV